MAQRVQVLLEDDIDHTPADETVTFSLDGVSYEIDLSSANAAKLREDLSSWVGFARRAGGRRTTGRSSAASTSSKNTRDLTDVRSWARNNGHTVSERGRVSAKVLAAYDKAH